MRKRIKKRGKKQGISPLIATVLLVGFTIAVVAVVMIWGKNYFEETSEKQGVVSKQKFDCSMIEITIRSAISGQGSQDVFISTENLKNIEIDGFIARVEGEDGVDPVKIFEPLSGLSSNNYDVSFIEDIGDPKKVTMIPRMELGQGVWLPCSDQAITSIIDIK